VPTQIDDNVWQLALDLLIDSVPDHNGPRRRKLLEPGCDIYSVTMYRVAFKDDIAKIYAHAERDAAIFGPFRIAQSNLLLGLDCALHGIYRTRELDQQAVPSRADDPAFELFDLGINQLHAQRLETGKRSFFVSRHEA
jgi:hypothetical protein